MEWIWLALAIWMIGVVVVLVLLRMAGNQDRAARHAQKKLDPHSDVTITRTAGW